MVLDLKPLQGGKLLAVGALQFQDTSFFSLRLNINGSYDMSYGLNGRKIYPINEFSIPSNDLTSARILKDNSALFQVKLIYYGSTSITDTSEINLFKIDNTGSAQTSFGVSAYAKFREATNAIAMEEDKLGRLVFCSYSPYPAGSQTVRFRRLSPLGAAEPGFGSSGVLFSQPISPDTYMNASQMYDIRMNPENDDITLIASRSATYAPTTFRILNYHPDANWNPATEISESETAVFSLFPNPAEQSFNINSEKASFYKMYNTVGALIQSGMLNPGINHIRITENTAPGIYLLQIIDEAHKSKTEKLFVK
jgi:hypothetical protein